MKKITAILTAAILLLTAVCAAAEPAVSVRAELGGGTGVFTTVITAAFTDEGVALKWDLVENTVFLQKYEPDGESLSSEDLNAAWISDDTLKSLEETVRAWAEQRMVSTGKGVFSGDAFNIAYKEDTYIFSMDDLLQLVKAIGQAAPDMARWTSLAETGLEGAAFSGGTEGTLKVYDDGKYYSLTLKQQGNTVFTLSLNAADPQELLAVAGHRENGKNYYHNIQITGDEKTARIETVLLADDTGGGFAALGDRNRILTTSAVITEGGDDSYTIQYTAIPADGSDALTASIVMELTEDPDPVPEGSTVIDFDTASEEELNEKLSGFTEKLPSLMIQLMTAVPMPFLDLIFED